jgi:5-enolpyruvylshikimate-3-phosphate synthase
VDGYYDHRMVLSFSVAGLNSDGETRISDAQMLAKSFEAYIPNMQQAGADFKLIEEQ